MKPERAFIAERAVARHDPALLRPGPATAELIAALGRTADRMARHLRDAFEPLLGGATPQVNPMRPMQTDYADFCSEVPRLAANSLFRIGSAPLVATVEGENVLRLVDRAFGGPGDTPSSLPREFPLSADLMIGRIEHIVASSLAHAMGPATADAVTAIRRDSSIAELQAFPAATPVASLGFNVLEQGRMPWAISFAFPMDTLAQIFAQGETAAAPRTPRGPALPTDEPFAEVPLQVSAVLVDMRLPLATISELSVGQVLSVPIARNVPLVVGERTYARGTIGSVEDHVAIQITQFS